MLSKYLILKIQFSSFILFFLTVFMLAPTTGWAKTDERPKPTCVQQGIWRIPVGNTDVQETRLLDRMAKRPVVMLGEAHTSAEHHRWQLHVLSALYSRNPNMVLGFEAFPRSLQAVLDRWTRGELNEKKFLELARWDEVWRYDPGLYMPLFHFARMHRIPMRALNVDRQLIRRVSSEGWDTIPKDQRRGVSDPAAPSSAYRESLEKVFGLHGKKTKANGTDAKLSDEEQKRMESFIEAQTIWDRAMAQGIAEIRTAGGSPLVVAIVGRGHVEYGYGIPHQLADLGIAAAAVLLPWDKALPCEELTTREGTPVADMVFGVDAPGETKAPPKPMLGVQIENTDANGEKGIKIVKVLKSSIAAAAGLEKDDIIIEAAGLKTPQTRSLIATIRRQSRGTWLPIVILRQGKRMDIVVKFPARSEHP